MFTSGGTTRVSHETARYTIQPNMAGWRLGRCVIFIGFKGSGRLSGILCNLFVFISSSQSKKQQLTHIDDGIFKKLKVTL